MITHIKYIFLLLFVVFALNTNAQNPTIRSVTEYPRVDNTLRSNYATIRIKRVFVGDEATLVEFDYYPSKNVSGGWISMSSGTILKCRLSSRKYKIIDWGYIDKDDKYNKMNFNEKYSVDAGGSYTFYMGFEGITNPTNNISIYEDGYNGFYWEGIHLNNYNSYSSSSNGNSNSNSSSEQKQIAKFIITNAKNNGVDVTQQVVNNGGYTVFYTVGEKTFMANYFEKQDSQSWGEIYNFTENENPETSSSYKTDVFKFSWSYSNSYDSKTGTCQCVLTKIYKPQGIVSILKMVTESLDVIEYTGYMEGSLDFNSFNK